MNRNIDGTELSTEQLLEIAETCGTDMVRLADFRAHLHHDAMFRSHLLTITAKQRLTMFSQGELVLNTRTERNSPDG